MTDMERVQYSILAMKLGPCALQASFIVLRFSLMTVQRHVGERRGAPCGPLDGCDPSSSAGSPGSRSRHSHYV